jgi:transposase
MEMVIDLDRRFRFNYKVLFSSRIKIDVVVYENLQIANMVKNHHLAKSISDAGWYQYTQWLDYYGKVWDKAVVAVSPNYTHVSRLL